VDVPTQVTPELERRLLDLQPWMHPYRFDPETIVGFFKYQLVDQPNVCTANSPRASIRAMQSAYDDVMRGDPLWLVSELAARGLLAGTALDIACATGMYTFGLADAGARDILGVEIRPEQVEQAQLVRSLDPARFDAARFEHEPTSADDPQFRAGESYDLVLSIGLLYHLTDPVQHLRNLRRLTRGALLLNTLTTPEADGHWLLVLEDPAGMTKAVGGVSWIPHWAAVEPLLRGVGFAHVEPIASALLAELQVWDRRRHTGWELLLPWGAVKLVDRRRSRRVQDRARAALRLGVNPRYYTYLAW
jgi:SAM-dependent methyltransferase